VGGLDELSRKFENEEEGTCPAIVEVARGEASLTWSVPEGFDRFVFFSSSSLLLLLTPHTLPSIDIQIRSPLRSSSPKPRLLLQNHSPWISFDVHPPSTFLLNLSPRPTYLPFHRRRLFPRDSSYDGPLGLVHRWRKWYGQRSRVVSRRRTRRSWTMGGGQQC